jgi:hypothetical protein
VATFKLANLPQWVQKTQKVMDAVVGQTTAELLADTPVIPGIARGGSRRAGTIPRDLGALALSLQSSLYGSTALNATGTESYVIVAGAMRAGDVARFAWGGPAAPYAPEVHYGANGVQGTFWIDEIANRFQPTVNSVVRRVRAELR